VGRGRVVGVDVPVLAAALRSTDRAGNGSQSGDLDRMQQVPGPGVHDVQGADRVTRPVHHQVLIGSVRSVGQPERLQHRVRVLGDEFRPVFGLRVMRVSSQEASPGSLEVRPHEHAAIGSDRHRGLGVAAFHHRDQGRVMRVRGRQISQIHVIAGGGALGGIDHEPLAVAGDPHRVVVRDS